MRLGYLVVPQDLVDAFIAARALSDRQSPSVTQTVLADFIEEGHFARHVRRMRALYAERQAALVEAGRRSLAALLELCPSEAGMHLVGWLPAGVDDRAAARAARGAGVEAAPLSAFRADASPASALVLGYAAWDAREIREGANSLARALRRVPGMRTPV